MTSVERSKASSVSKPVDDAAGNDDVEIVVPPGKHIAVPPEALVDVLRSRMRMSDSHKFNEICRTISGLTQLEFIEFRRRLKHNFRLFSVAALNHDLISRKGRGIPNKGDLDYREQEFIRDFCGLMHQARFSILTEDEFRIAKQAEFELTMPVVVNWDFMDRRLLSTFWEENPQDPDVDTPFPHARSCLVFHRGIGVAHKTDLFVNDKLDLLARYLIIEPAAALWSWLRGSARAADGSEADAARRVKIESRTQDKHEKTIHRRTLKSIMPNTLSVLAHSYKKITIAEPTFKESVLMYRAAVKKPTKKELKKDPKLANQYRLRKRNIYVKMFDEIPMADLEMIFPDKKVHIPPFSMLVLLLTVIAAVIGSIVSIATGAVDLAALGSILSVLGGKVFQSYTSMERQRSDMMKAMSLKLYDVTLDSQEGVIAKLLDSMSDQFHKELLLAYAMLILNSSDGQGSGVSAEALDETCEEFLVDTFGVRTDFAIADALPRLVALGLVVVDQRTGKLRPSTLDYASDVLADKWEGALQLASEGKSVLTGQPREKGSALGATKALLTSTFARGKRRKQFMGSDSADEGCVGCLPCRRRR